MNGLERRPVPREDDGTARAQRIAREGHALWRKVGADLERRYPPDRYTYAFAFDAAGHLVGFTPTRRRDAPATSARARRPAHPEVARKQRELAARMASWR